MTIRGQKSEDRRQIAAGRSTIRIGEAGTRPKGGSQKDNIAIPARHASKARRAGEISGLTG
jgi:hypothetical protein